MKQPEVIQLSLFTQTPSKPVTTVDLETAYDKQGDEIAYKKTVKNTE
jgi:hypothetical protein